MSADERTDGELMSSSLVDPEAFRVVFDRHFSSIRQYLGRRFDSASADDLAAETFATAFRARAQFDATRPDARPWLYRIAQNLARRHWRSEKRMLRAYARAAVSPSADEAGDAEARVDAQREAKTLALALRRLPRTQRDVLLLHAWSGLSDQEIAEVLSIRAGTVRSRLSRARASVREQISESGITTVRGNPSPRDVSLSG